MSLEWQQPLWLVLSLTPLAFWLLERRRRNAILSYAAPHLRRWAILEIRPGQRPWHHILQVLVWALLAISLAGPRWPMLVDIRSPTDELSRGDVSYILVLDVSEAMQVADLSTSRRQRARAEINDLLDRLRGERIGLVVFGAGAGLQTPPTDDYNAFRFYLSHSDAVLSGRGENTLPKALRIASRQLPQDRLTQQAVILVTAGDSRLLNGTPGAHVLAEVDRLRQLDIPLYILGVAEPDSSKVSIPNTNTDPMPAGTHVDHHRLAELAKLTNGSFSNITNGDKDWQILYDSGMATLPSDFQPIHAQRSYRELYTWSLLAALCLLLARPLLTNVSRIAGVAVVSCVGILFISVPSLSHAETNEQTAYRAFEQKDYALAQILYSRMPGYAARMGEGASAFNRDDFLHARDQFTQALLHAQDDPQRANALYNRGNSLFRLEHYSQAKEAFRDALRYHPEHRAADINLALTESILLNQRDVARGDPNLPGRRAAEEYGRSYDPDDEDFPDDVPSEKTVSTAGQPDELGRRVARGEIVPQADTENRVAKTQFDFSDTERAASKKKMELAHDDVVELLQALIIDEQVELTLP